MSPLSAALEKLQQEKHELLERKRQRQEEGQEKVRDALNLKFKVCVSLSGSPVRTCFPECVHVFSLLHARLMP